MPETPLLDAHLHLADPRLREHLTAELTRAREAGVGRFLSCALNAEEMEWHRGQCIEGMRWVAGIHPHWEHSHAGDLPLLEDLAQGGLLAGIGEVGLDRRGDLDHQLPLLERQLGLAHELRLPVVFHCVRAWYELYALLKKRFPHVRGVLHGYSAGVDVLEAFTSLDVAVSLGGGITQRPDANKVLRRVVRHGRFLVETDAPWQLPRWLEDEHNRPVHLVAITRRLAELAGADWDDFIAMQWATARELEFL